MFLPKLLAVVVLSSMLATGLLTVLRPWVAKPAPWLYHGLAPELRGVLARGDLPLTSIPSILTGRLQRALEIWVGDNIPQRELVVRSFNEFLWRSFGTSVMSNGQIVVGRKRTLFEMGYLLSYCGLQKTTDADALFDFAKRLRFAQDWFANRGQRFVYMVAPMKVSWFPDRIPSSYPCRDSTRDRIYPLAIRALQSKGINLVDARAALEAARFNRLPVELFPRNGIHWNWLGAATAANALADKVRSLSLPDLPHLSYDVTIESDELPNSFDRDLSDLLNLLITPRGDPSPVLRIKEGQIRSVGCTLAAINDSFLHQPAYLLQTGGVFASVETNSYFNLARRHFPDWRPYPVDPAAPDAYAFLFSADVVVLEEVENNIGGTLAMRFLDLVERERMRTGSGGTSSVLTHCQVRGTAPG